MPKPDSPWSDGNEILLATLEEIELPKRLVRSMGRDDIYLVGELLQMTQSEILDKRGLGQKSLNLALASLAKLGFAPGMSLKGWDSSRAWNMRKEMGRDFHRRLFERIGAEWKEHDSLESELRSLLLEVSQKRNAEILSLFYGFNENGPRTLESTGQQYGLTRERVRQIAAKTEDRLRSVWLPTKYIFALRDLICSDLKRPFTAAEFSKAAKAAGITKIEFHVEGAIRALGLIGESENIERFQVSDAVFYGNRSDRKFVKALLHRIGKDTSAKGCISIDRLTRMSGPVAKDLDEIHRVLSSFEEIRWLDDDRTWMMSVAVSRNRLVNVTRGIFSVIRSLDVEVLRTALKRPRRIALVPPAEILGKFLEVTGVAKIVNGRAEALRGNAKGELGMNDTAFVTAFRELGSPVTREKLEEHCVKKLGVNVRSFYVNLSYSPLVAKVAPGIFSLVGETIDPEQLKRLKSQVKRGWYRRSG